MKLWSLMAIATVVMGGGASATVRPVTTEKLPAIVRQGILSTIYIVKARGAVGLRSDLEKCYGRIRRTRDQTAAIFCMTQDLTETTTMRVLFPNAPDDPFFNMNSMSQRGAHAVTLTVQPESARTAFTNAWMATATEEAKQLNEQLEAPAGKDGQ